MNKELRKRVKMLKAFQNISYKEISSYIGIQPNSLYNWLRNEYDLSPARQKLLSEILDCLSEPE